MANLLKMAISQTIRTLHHRGWSQRRIADELGISREAVACHLRQAQPPPKPANATPGSEADQDAAGLPPIADGPRPSAGLAGDPYSGGGWGILVGSPIM
jgi:hypothetical protein